jgi:hypothetical protein
MVCGQLCANNGGFSGGGSCAISTCIVSSTS